MGHVGFKEWAYRFLSAKYPQTYSPAYVAARALENGIISDSKDPLGSLDTTLRRAARPGDDYKDPRFAQRLDGGRIVILAYPPGYRNGDVAETESAGTFRDQRMSGEIDCHESEGKLDSDCLADLLVDHGEFPHRVDALKAIAELSLRGVLIPQRLLNGLESAITEEREARQMMRKLISQVRSLLDTTHP